VAILGRILRFVLWLLLATWLARKLLGWLFGNSHQPEPRNVPPASGRQLYRDPVCGTHVAPEISQTIEYAGQQYHFCSAECRARFLEARRLQASA
jgi:YHS domain-containing protein